MTANAIIGVDVGATTTAAGLVTRRGDVLRAMQRPTHADGPGSALGTLLGLVSQLLAEASAQALTVDGIGIGVAGVVDTRKGAMQPHPHNRLPELGHVSLIDEVQRLADVPVFVDNDANALALAEWIFGAGRGAHSLVLMAIGTSVGGGIILGDALLRGGNGAAGELHGIPIDYQGRRCFCGGRGCLGAYVEGHAIATAAREALAMGCASSLHAATGGDASRVTAELVFAAAASGDDLARMVVADVCQALGAGIAFLVNALNPDVVVVTGGVARSLVPLAADVRRCVAAYTFATGQLTHTRIVVVGGDKHRTVRGGAALVVYETSGTRPASAPWTEPVLSNDLVEREG